MRVEVCRTVVLKRLLVMCSLLSSRAIVVFACALSLSLLSQSHGRLKALQRKDNLMVSAGRSSKSAYPSLEDITIDELNTYLNNGSLTSYDLVRVSHRKIYMRGNRNNTRRCISRGPLKLTMSYMQSASSIQMPWILLVASTRSGYGGTCEGKP